MDRRGGIPDLVLGISQFEQHRAVDPYRAGGSSSARRSSAAAVSGAPPPSADRAASRSMATTSASPLGGVASRCTAMAPGSARCPCSRRAARRMQISLLGGGQIFVDRGPNNGVCEAQWLSTEPAPRGRRGRAARLWALSGIHCGQLSAHRQSCLFAKDGHRPSQRRCLRVEATDAQQHRLRRCVLGAMSADCLGIDLVGRARPRGETRREVRRAETGLPPVASVHARHSSALASSPMSDRTSCRTADSPSGRGRSMGGRASSSSEPRSPAGAYRHLLARSARLTTGRPASRFARCSRKRSDGSSAHCASSTVKDQRGAFGDVCDKPVQAVQVANATSPVLLRRGESR